MGPHTLEAILVEYINDPHLFLYHHRDLLHNPLEDVKCAYKLLLLEETTNPYFCLNDEDQPRVIGKELDCRSVKLLTYIDMDIHFHLLWSQRCSPRSIITTQIRFLLLPSVLQFYNVSPSPSSYLDHMILKASELDLVYRNILQYKTWSALMFFHWFDPRKRPHYTNMTPVMKAHLDKLSRNN